MLSHMLQLLIPMEPTASGFISLYHRNQYCIRTYWGMERRVAFGWISTRSRNADSLLNSKGYFTIACSLMTFLSIKSDRLVGIQEIFLHTTSSYPWESGTVRQE